MRIGGGKWKKLEYSEWRGGGRWRGGQGQGYGMWVCVWAFICPHDAQDGELNTLIHLGA